jgi:hypothetical protein
LRKTGASYREVARRLGVDVHTAHADVAAELAALRETAVTEATELRGLELERLDGMTSGLWPAIQEGSAATVSSGLRVSERRARLLGLDAPTLAKGNSPARRARTRSGSRSSASCSPSWMSRSSRSWPRRARRSSTARRQW